MGKNRDKAGALFDKLERELNELAKSSGRTVRLKKSWRISMLKKAKDRGVTIEQLLDHVRPSFVKSVQQMNLIKTDETVPFTVLGPDLPTQH